MAIDYDAAIKTIDAMISRLQELKNMVLALKRPFAKVGTSVTIPYTTDQKTTITSMYVGARTELAKLFLDLPEKG